MYETKTCLRERAPETTRLTNQIADVTRGKVAATPKKLANLKAQREEAKLREGVGKRGPKGATPKKLSKKAEKLPKKNKKSIRIIII